MRRFNPEWLNKPRKRGNPEGQLQLTIIKHCKARGWVIGKIKNKGSRIGKSFIFDPYQFLGLPDLLLFTATKMYFLEIKSPQGKQSEHQRLFQGMCNSVGVEYILVKSLKDIEKIT